MRAGKEGQRPVLEVLHLAVVLAAQSQLAMEAVEARRASLTFMLDHNQETVVQAAQVRQRAAAVPAAGIAANRADQVA